jgi:hypothetical protein
MVKQAAAMRAAGTQRERGRQDEVLEHMRELPE